MFLSKVIYDLHIVCKLLLCRISKYLFSNRYNDNSLVNQIHLGDNNLYLLNSLVRETMCFADVWHTQYTEETKK